MHNLKAENSVLFSRFAEDLSLEAACQIVLRDCSEEVMEKPGYTGILQQKPGSLNIKKLLLEKMKHFKLMNSAVYVFCSRFS